MTAAPGLRVRPASTADAGSLQALSTATIRRSAASHYIGPQLEAWAATRSVTGHRQMIRETSVLVAVDAEDAVAGFASVALTPTGKLKRGEVDQLFVGPGMADEGSPACCSRRSRSPPKQPASRS